MSCPISVFSQRKRNILVFDVYTSYPLLMCVKMYAGLLNSHHKNSNTQFVLIVWIDGNLISPWIRPFGEFPFVLRKSGLPNRSFV
jgi:hypothetical protein